MRVDNIETPGETGEMYGVAKGHLRGQRMNGHDEADDESEKDHRHLLDIGPSQRFDAAGGRIHDD